MSDNPCRRRMPRLGVGARRRWATGDRHPLEGRRRGEFHACAVRVHVHLVAFEPLARLPHVVAEVAIGDRDRRAVPPRRAEAPRRRRRPGCGPDASGASKWPGQRRGVRGRPARQRLRLSLLRSRRASPSRFPLNRRLPAGHRCSDNGLCIVAPEQSSRRNVPRRGTAIEGARPDARLVPVCGRNGGLTIVGALAEFVGRRTPVVDEECAPLAVRFAGEDVGVESGCVAYPPHRPHTGES